jgi:hypothetical protein
LFAEFSKNLRADSVSLCLRVELLFGAEEDSGMLVQHS